MQREVALPGPTACPAPEQQAVAVLALRHSIDDFRVQEVLVGHHHGQLGDGAAGEQGRQCVRGARCSGGAGGSGNSRGPRAGLLRQHGVMLVGGSCDDEAPGRAVAEAPHTRRRCRPRPADESSRFGGQAA